MLDDGAAPRALLNRPAIKRHHLLIWDAFHALSGDRQIGMMVGPIPFSAIDRYAARLGIVGEEFERFHALLTAMDAVHQKHLADKMKEAGNG